MTVDEIFQGLASLPRWVPYKLVYNAKREKFDKIPHNGRHGLKTSEDADWSNLMDAIAIVNDQYGLSGVGFVMTGGIEADEWTLIGFDFDDVTDKFVPPIDTYSERSPSKVGVRSFAWAPTKWAKRFQDTLDCKPLHCEHAEIYLGTAPRFLTVTFDAINEQEIIRLKPNNLKMIEAWGLHLYKAPPVVIPEAPFLDTTGTLLDLSKFKLTIEQNKLIEGKGKVDRSKIMMGFLIRLLDGGASQEDVLATMVKTETLWQYLLDHRNNEPDKALKFAKEEITRAYAKSTVGMKAELIGYSDKWKIPDAKEIAASPPLRKTNLGFPMEVFVKAPGLVGEIAHWILGASYVPREEFAYAAALSMVACMVGPYCTHGSGSRSGKLNLYMTMVGGTGTGKTEAIEGMSLLLNETDAKDCILDFPASEAALRRQLTVTPNLLLKVDELAHKLEGMRESSNGSNMGRAVLEAYDGGRMPPKVYADSKNTLPAVENPFVQIIGGTTDKVWDVVRTSHMEDGTLNRFVFVCLVDEPEYRFNPEPDATIPKVLKDKLNVFWREGRMSDLVGDMPGFNRHIKYCAKVKEAMETLNQQAWELQQGEYGSLYPRYVQNTMKVASIIAIGDGRKEVSMKDFGQAQRFVRWSVTNVANKISTRLANSNYERLEKRLINKLAKSGGRLQMREAYKFMHIYRREMDELTATLTMAGLIDIDIGENEAEWIILL